MNKSLDKSFSELKSEHGTPIEDANPTNDSAIISRCAADIKPQKIDWLWPQRFARGKVSMIVGDPGLGKSQIISNMSATITNSATWPDDSTCDGGNVYILSAEDKADDTIVPRLIAANADLAKVHIIESVKRKSRNGTHSEDQFSLDTDLNELDNKLSQLPAAAIFIDPITAYLGKTESHNNAAVRGLLSLVSKLAEKHNTAVICVSHLNKNNMSDPIARVTGSGAFVAASRAVFVVVGDKDDDNQRLFLPLKNNIGGDKLGLSFRVEPYAISSDNNAEITISKISWICCNITTTVEEAMSRQQEGGAKYSTSEAQNFLNELLSKGEMPVTEILKLADDEGLSTKSIRKAGKKLGIISRKNGAGKGAANYWSLPSTKHTQTFPSSAGDKFEKFGTIAKCRNSSSTFDLTKDEYNIYTSL
jgi:hypothetical protein